MHMIIDKSLMDTVRKSCDRFTFNEFKKVIEQLNFEDGMSGTFFKDKRIFIEVSFENSWRLKVWCDGEYSMFFDKEKDNKIHVCSYDKLLKFMKKNKIIKKEQCEYKDAELYIIEFNNDKKQ